MITQLSEASATDAVSVELPQPGPMAPLSRSLEPIRTGLRLLAPADALDLLRQAPIITQHAINRGVVRRLEAIYYDTPDHALFEGGFSLRVQKHGRRFTQRLRQHGSPPATWEWTTQGMLPDLSCLSNAVGEELPSSLFAAPLTAMFTTTLRRQSLRLELPGALVDVAFDEGVIEAASGQQKLSEIRLALQSGDAGMLYEIGMRLLERAPLRVNTTSIARRGYALASGARPKAERAAASVLTMAFLVDDVVAALLGGCQAHLQANQDAACDGRSEQGVHQMRVALRRMRTAFSWLGRELGSPMMQSLSAEAKWLADALGPARGWDVFLNTTLLRPASLERGGIDFDGLRRLAEVPRQAGYEAARAAILSARHGRFQMALSHWIARRGWRLEVDRDGIGILAEPASGLAARVLDRLHRKALRQGRRFDRMSAPQRHELRITLKKLRYTTEFFLPLCPQPALATRFVRRLGVLQEALGLDQDAATTQPLLDLLGSVDAQTPSGVHQAIGVVVGWQARQTLAVAGALSSNWQKFKAAPLFWD